MHDLRTYNLNTSRASRAGLEIFGWSGTAMQACTRAETSAEIPSASITSGPDAAMLRRVIDVLAVTAPSRTSLLSIYLMSVHQTVSQSDATHTTIARTSSASTLPSAVKVLAAAIVNDSANQHQTHSHHIQKRLTFEIGCTVQLL